MPDETLTTSYTPEEYAIFIDERKSLIEAAREGARTFDQAILAFGSAAFGFSVAFIPRTPLPPPPPPPAKPPED